MAVPPNGIPCKICGHRLNSGHPYFKAKKCLKCGCGYHK